MVTRVLNVAALALVWTLCASAQFEGVVELEMTTDDGLGASESMAFVLHVIPGKIAAEVHGDGEHPVTMKAVFDAGRSTLTVIDDNRQTYAELQSTHGTVGADPSLDGEVNFVRLRTETLRGKACEVWKCSFEEETTTLWGMPGYDDLLNELSRFVQAVGSLFGGQPDNIWNAINRKGLLPVRMVTVSADGVSEALETTLVERKTVERGLFAIPSGYTRVETLDPFPMDEDPDQEDETDEPE